MQVFITYNENSYFDIHQCEMVFRHQLNPIRLFTMKI
jgi:hypothetical protein